ncbi:MAG: uracil-DNA glycosylase [Gammaproteobacteria bacterium]
MRLQYLEAMGIDVWISKTSVITQQTSSSDGIADNIPPKSTGNWETLKTEVAQCTQCDLCSTRTQTVFGSGNINADWMIVGEAPGQNEDQQGLPFVGSAGLLLTEMLRAAGLDREQVFITNIVKCRPPDNREPEPTEIETCKAYLLRQQALIKPKIILALGHVAAQTLLSTDEPIAALRGKIHALNDTPVVVTYHPAYLLRSLLDKREAWADLKFAMQIVKNHNK